MVVIRLARAGAKKSPFYHIVVTDKRNARDGRFIERIGYYNPVARGNVQPLTVDKERANYWLGQGAQPSDRVSGLLQMMEKGITPEVLPTRAEQRKQQSEAALVAKKAKPQPVEAEPQAE